MFFSGDTRVADAAISRFAPFEVSTHCPSFSPLAIEKRTGWGQIALADHVTFQQTNATAEADKQTSTTRPLFKAHWKESSFLAVVPVTAFVEAARRFFAFLSSSPNECSLLTHQFSCRRVMLPFSPDHGGKRELITARSNFSRHSDAFCLGRPPGFMAHLHASLACVRVCLCVYARMGVCVGSHVLRCVRAHLLVDRRQ